MANYHLYWLYDRGKIRSEESLEAGSDEGAIAKARAMKKPIQCEVWGNGRQLAIISAQWQV